MSDNPFAFTPGDPMEGVSFEPRERRERRIEPVQRQYGVRQNFPPPQRVAREAPDDPLALPPLAGVRAERAPRRETRMQRATLVGSGATRRYAIDESQRSLSPARRIDGGEIIRRETRMQQGTLVGSGDDLRYDPSF